MSAAIFFQSFVALQTFGNPETTPQPWESLHPATSFSLRAFRAVCSQQQPRNSGDAVCFKLDQSSPSHQGCQWGRYGSSKWACTHIHTNQTGTQAESEALCTHLAWELTQAQRYANRPTNACPDLAPTALVVTFMTKSEPEKHKDINTCHIRRSPVDSGFLWMKTLSEGAKTSLINQFFLFVLFYVFLSWNLTESVTGETNCFLPVLFKRLQSLTSCSQKF